MPDYFSDGSRLEVIWPLDRWHYLTVTSAEEYDHSRPYRTCNAMILELPDAEPEAVVARFKVHDYIHAAENLVSKEWRLLRDIAALVGHDADMAKLGHALMVAVSHGLIQRKQVIVDINGKPTTRWAYSR